MELFSIVVMETFQSTSDWLLNTKSRVLQADWLKLENNEKAILNFNMPYLEAH